MSQSGSGMSDDDFPRRQGGAAIGARLRRLSAAIDADAARLYARLGIRFEQRWFGVLNQLALNGSMSVAELSATLGITHVSIIQTRQSLERAGLVLSKTDKLDARKRLLTLSAKGRRTVAELESVWRAFDEAARELDAEAGHVVQALDRLEKALQRKSLLERLGEHLDVAAHAPAEE